ncbi:hypothetical protein ASZ90_016259 [hydrocarbon metagenome]|uniref:TIR domain-containing protein n=1 Tax=hydrocarbon metagenome TaxID=938273 RepID=A0A0W8F045_9ZZZZ
MSRTAEETKIIRDRILELIYSAVEGNTSKHINYKSIGSELELSAEEIISFISTLQDMGFIRRIRADEISITYEGIKKIEDRAMVHMYSSSIKTTSAKPLIFVSHINEEKELAASLKTLLELGFGQTIDIFVSSDKKSIPYGHYWFDEIRKAMSNCTIALILCSNLSIKEPWINFETGAAFIGNKKIIPLCYGGLTPSTLPVPLNYLQGVSAFKLDELSLLIEQISETLQIELKDIKIVESDFYTRVNSLPAIEQVFNITAVLEGGGIYKQGESITITGVAKSKSPFGDLKVYKLDKEPHLSLVQKIEIQPDNTFSTQFSTVGYPKGSYGATVELPSGLWTRIQFIIE